MGWEKRSNGRKYFYLSHREGGKVVKEYYGCGFAAQLAEQQLQARKLKRKIDRGAVCAAKEALVAPEMILKNASKLTQHFPVIAPSVPTGPLSAGQIDIEHRMHPSPDCRFHSPEIVDNSQGDPVAEIQDLLARIGHGDPIANKELEAFLDQYPELWLILGDVGEQAIQAWLKLVSGSIPVMAMAAKKKLDVLRAELLQDGSNVVARLYADRVMATWLQMTYADTKYALADPTCLSMLEFLARRQKQAQHQHLSALNAWSIWSRTQAQLNQVDQPKVRTDASDAPTVLSFACRTADGPAEKRATANK